MAIALQSAPGASLFPALEGQHVVVLGGSSGIGLATARCARYLGAEVTLVARQRAKLQQAAEAVEGARLLCADLLAPATLSAAFRDLPVIDHLIVTAGTARLTALQDSRAEDLQRVSDERLIGPLLAIQAAAPRLAPTGSITLMSAQLAARPLGVGAIMAAAVAAVESLVRALALELAPIRVNAVAPGMIDTPLLDVLLGDSKAQVSESVAASLPVKRIGHADDVARAILLLMSNGFISGEVLHVDGGGRWV
ncbi:SDR family oxidoreductase [Paludibacterium purpuratum]|uniref:NAD(P)-dependent dehydrogenase (Short-subunit alcohol dehydrogenase family) n=1 Tax=Paludibacterium purpuratum TaxID=1144873 RepID=A0A4R7B1B3_9NEIS|nr:SDR family oxidoreductase [Paludibacterium purpuratum]TDR76491.1 NAD(P)-dependent dehydrogenase (short-subunit alcohol dehydrogenase family) [Paludibacterium purpuratum]